MKNKKSLLLFIATLALGSPAVYAADLTWDNSATAGIQVPATGTWNNAVAGWSTNGTTLVNWAAANVAIFGGADGTYAVTVGGTFSAQKISFVNSGYTLSGTSSRVITLTASAGTTNLPQLAIIGGKSATIGSNVTVNAQQTFYIGAADGNAGGTLNIEGGTVGTSTNLGSSVVIDGNGTVVNVKTGGTLRLMNTGNSNSNAAIVVGQLGSSNASLNVDGGSVLVNQGNSAGTGGFLIGNIGQGTVTLTNGSINVLSTAPLGVTFGNNVASAGANVLHLDGGTLTTSIIRKGAGTATATFNFNGGLLKANANNANFMTGLTTANVKAGGAKIDSNGFNITIGQALVADSPSGGLTKEGGLGTLTLSGTNTYTGATNVNAGTLTLGHATDTLTGAITVSGGTLNVDNPDTVGAVTLTSGTISGDSALTGTSYAVESGNVSSELAGSGVALTKTTAGTVTLSGANSYTGATNVNAGTLLVNGSLASGSAVSVGANGTLGGSGTLSGTLALTGTLSPGATAEDIQTLNAGNTTWNGGSIWNFDLSSVNNTSDKLMITGDLVKGTGVVGTDFAFNFMGSTPVWNTTYTLAEWSGSLTGFTLGTDFTFSNLGAGPYGTSSFAIVGNTLQFTAVPEPTSALAGLLLGAGLLRRKRNIER